MIATQYIKSITQKPKAYLNYLTFDVMSWSNSRFKSLSPFFLKTDGNEKNFNNGGIVFENFYQGSKVYPKVFKNEVYTSRYQHGDERYLKWRWIPTNPEGDDLITDDELNFEKYMRWRNSLWACPNPVRYPNGYTNKSKVSYTLIIDKNDKMTELDYLASRKTLYLKEYVRLVRKTSEYHHLLSLLKEGKNLLLCEIDVPAKGKKGEYGKDVDHNNNCVLDIPKLVTLLEDPSEPFGHGLCLSLALLWDLQK